MLRFLIGLCLLPFAIFGVLMSFFMVTKVIDCARPSRQVATHHETAPTVQTTPVKQKGR